MAAELKAIADALRRARNSLGAQIVTNFANSAEKQGFIPSSLSGAEQSSLPKVKPGQKPDVIDVIPRNAE